MYLDQAAAPLVSVATCVAGRMSTPRWNLLLVAHTRLARVLVLFYWKPRQQKLIAKPPCCKPTLATQSWNFLIVKRKWHFNRCSCNITISPISLWNASFKHFDPRRLWTHWAFRFEGAKWSTTTLQSGARRDSWRHCGHLRGWSKIYCSRCVENTTRVCWP